MVGRLESLSWDGPNEEPAQTLGLLGSGLRPKGHSTHNFVYPPTESVKGRGISVSRQKR